MRFSSCLESQLIGCLRSIRVHVPGQCNLHHLFALTDLQPDSISVGYHRVSHTKILHSHTKNDF